VKKDIKSKYEKKEKILKLQMERVEKEIEV
jgi:hypothetical protein